MGWLWGGGDKEKDSEKAGGGKELISGDEEKELRAARVRQADSDQLLSGYSLRVVAVGSKGNTIDDDDDDDDDDTTGSRSGHQQQQQQREAQRPDRGSSKGSAGNQRYDSSIASGMGRGRGDADPYESEADETSRPFLPSDTRPPLASRHGGGGGGGGGEGKPGSGGGTRMDSANVTSSRPGSDSGGWQPSRGNSARMMYAADDDGEGRDRGGSGSLSTTDKASDRPSTTGSGASFLPGAPLTDEELTTAATLRALHERHAPGGGMHGEEEKNDHGHDGDDGGDGLGGETLLTDEDGNKLVSLHHEMVGSERVKMVKVMGGSIDDDKNWNLRVTDSQVYLGSDFILRHLDGDIPPGPEGDVIRYHRHREKMALIEAQELKEARAKEWNTKWNRRLWAWGTISCPFVSLALMIAIPVALNRVLPNPGCSPGYYFGKAPDDKIYNLKKCIRCPETTFSLAGSEGMSSCFCKGGYYGKDQNCTACDRGLWAPTGISTNRTDCLPIDSYWRIASYGQTCEAACKIDNKTSDEESMRLWENTAESPVDMMELLNFNLVLQCLDIRISHRSNGPWICSVEECGPLRGTCFYPGPPLRGDSEMDTPAIARRICSCYLPSDFDLSL